VRNHHGGFHLCFFRVWNVDHDGLFDLFGVGNFDRVLLLDFNPDRCRSTVCRGPATEMTCLSIVGKKRQEQRKGRKTCSCDSQGGVGSCHCLGCFSWKPRRLDLRCGANMGESGN
jgi:hypothetical protein